MRLKNYLAASMTEAMNQVKEELGPDAIIISAESVMPMSSKPFIMAQRRKGATSKCVDAPLGSITSC